MALTTASYCTLLSAAMMTADSADWLSCHWRAVVPISRRLSVFGVAGLEADVAVLADDDRGEALGLGLALADTGHVNGTGREHRRRDHEDDQ